MKASKGLWPWIGITSLICTILFVSGFISSIDHVIHPKPSNLVREELPARPSNPLADGKYRILALGDSLTKGTGDTSGQGYAGKVRQQLEEMIDGELLYTNFAVNGYRTDQLLHDVQQLNGTILQAQEADLILFTIGGNDVFNMSDPTQFEISVEEAMVRMPEALERLDAIVARLVELNSDAQIIYVSLFNPFIDVEAVSVETSLFVHGWNYEVQKRLSHYPTVTVVPTFDLFMGEVSQYLASDHYHPNESGHRRIAERIGQVLKVGGQDE